jgi:proline dehydrogenase
VLLDHAHSVIQERSLDSRHIEFEMLDGVTPERLQLMRDRGYRTGVYLPYGQEWYLYLCHRLAEYPPNVYQAIIDAVEM